MISIIISSYKETYFQRVKENIAETIGVEYEIIKIENPGLYSTSVAYNMGAAKAKYDILCFAHEDVKFYNVNWGINLLTHFENNIDLGLIGIAGSCKKLSLPTGWGYHDKSQNKINILQLDEKGNTYKLSTYVKSNVEFLKVIDGVFMVTLKHIWKALPFDESITGYHMYDIDFSLRISQKYKVAIVYDVVLEHFSHGNFGDEWINATINYHKDPKRAHLFDQQEQDYPLLRKPYYLLLASNTMSVKSKLLYIKNLGVDIRSIPALILFLFPPAFKILKKLNVIKGKASKD